MKRYIRSTTNAVTKIEVIFNIEVMLSAAENQVVAATYKGIEIPEGELPPADKDAIWNSQVYQNYLSFIDSVEEILQDYDLNIYYKNDSPDRSFYWSALAKNDDGSNLLDFTTRLRVATHPAHRTKESEHNKKLEKAELKKISKGKRVAPLNITVIVNNESTEFTSYLDVIEYIDKEIEHAVEIMTRRKKWYYIEEDYITRWKLLSCSTTS